MTIFTLLTASLGVALATTAPVLMFFSAFWMAAATGSIASAVAETLTGRSAGTAAAAFALPPAGCAAAALLALRAARSSGVGVPVCARPDASWKKRMADVVRDPGFPSAAPS